MKFLTKAIYLNEKEKNKKMNLIDTLIQIFIANYLGILFLMLLESASFPIPSEVVMPLVGVLARLGIIDIYYGILFGTAGSLIGSLIDYYIGYKLGYPFLEKYGRYFFISNKHLEYTSYLFNKYGILIVLIARFIPLIRTLISFPAGIGKMNVLTFLGVTLLGNLAWNIILSFIGFIYYEQWQFIISLINEYLLLIALIISFSILSYWIIKRKINRIYNLFLFRGKDI